MRWCAGADAGMWQNGSRYNEPDIMTQAQAPTARELDRWLLERAFPTWWRDGRDAIGGFHEALLDTGLPASFPKRVRVQSRQIYSYALAAQMGWTGDAHGAIAHGLAYLNAHGLRADGLCRHIVGPVCSAIDEGPDLYDQAFLLLALAEAFKVTGDTALRVQAHGLLRLIRRTFAHPVAGYVDRPAGCETQPRSAEITRLRSNPHMHLLEASLHWMEAENHEAWFEFASELVGLCRERFIAGNGALIEYFDAGWQPLDVGNCVEPGHLFEWVWLLRRFEIAGGAPTSDLYLPFYELAEQHGVCAVRCVAINALTVELEPLDQAARLWPQTERLKANVILARSASNGDERALYVARAGAAASSLARYFDNRREGQWYDKMRADGSFVEEPAPASSLYHIACAIREFGMLEQT